MSDSHETQGSTRGRGTGLRGQALRGFAWGFAERFAQQFVQFLVSVVLARILSPAEFGLIGMLAIFTALAQSLLDSGFGQALIQRQDATDVDRSSVFFINIGSGVALYALFWFSARPIAWFYRTPELEALTQFIGVNFIVNSLSLIQTVNLMKAVDFRSQAVVSVTAGVVSGTVGIWLARKGFGVWSLAWQMLVANIVRLVVLWAISPWRPRLLFSLQRVRLLFRFGSRLLAAGMLNVVFENIYTLIIGRLYSPGDVGLYVRAKRLQRLPLENTTKTLARVAFPVFSRVQNDPARLNQGYRTTIMLAGFLNSPLMLGLCVLAHPVIVVLLTDKWEGAAPFFQLLCIAGLFFPIHVLNLNLLAVKGRSDLFLRLGLVKRGITILLIALTYRFGVLGLLAGQVAMSVLVLGINTAYTTRFIDYPLWAQMRDFGRSVLVGAMACLLAWAASNALHTQWLRLVVGGATMAVAYGILSISLNRPTLAVIVDVLPRHLRTRTRTLLRLRA